MTEIELNKQISLLLEHRPTQERPKRLRAYLAREVQYKKDDFKLSLIQRYLFSPIGFVKWDFEGTTLRHSGHHIYYRQNSRRRCWMKRHTSKIVRRCRDISGKGNYYRRLYDFWWELD